MIRIFYSPTSTATAGANGVYTPGAHVPETDSMDDFRNLFLQQVARKLLKQFYNLSDADVRVFSKMMDKPKEYCIGQFYLFKRKFNYDNSDQSHQDAMKLFQKRELKSWELHNQLVNEAILQEGDFSKFSKDSRYTVGADPANILGIESGQALIEKHYKISRFSKEVMDTIGDDPLLKNVTDLTQDQTLFCRALYLAIHEDITSFCEESGYNWAKSYPLYRDIYPAAIESLFKRIKDTILTKLPEEKTYEKYLAALPQKKELVK